MERGRRFPVTLSIGQDGSLRREMGHCERQLDTYQLAAHRIIGSSVDDLDYEMLFWLAAGNSVFRPREATHEAEEAFREVVMRLVRLRDREHVSYLDGHVTKTGAGIYLVVGPVQLTAEGKAALARDQSLGLRPPRSGDALPWRM